MIYHIVAKRKADGSEYKLGFYLQKASAVRKVEQINSDETSMLTARLVESERLLRTVELLRKASA